MVALSVSAVILAAVATLAYAVGAANDTSDNTSQVQVKLRYTTLKISGLIKGSRLICDAGIGYILLWDSDDNMDGRIGIEELTYIETINKLNGLRLVTFNSGTSGTTLSIDFLKNGGARSWLGSNYVLSQTVLLRPVECGNVQFAVDILPPLSQLASVSFYLVENGLKHHYQIRAATRCWAGSLLIGGKLPGSTL
jgi:hypothetical protein